MKNAAILVADDDAAVRKVLRRALAKYDAPLLCAEDGVSALKIARKEVPALLILDIRMPRMGGFEVCAALRRAEKTKDIPILIAPRHRDLGTKSCRLEAAADPVHGLDPGAVPA